MHVIRFELSESNCVEVARERYFLFRTPDDDVSYLLPTTCPHRGGPLHLGCYVPERGALQCPWHKGNVSVQKLIRGALPMIAVRGQVTAVIPDTDGRAPIVTRRKTLFDAANASPPTSPGSKDHEKTHLDQ